MSSALYRNYLRLLEKWPLDATKKSRDFGEFIRSCVAIAFRGGTDEPRDSKKCEEIYTSLNNIASNRYKDAFYVSNPSSGSGNTQEECHKLISNEFLKLMEEENKTYKEKFTGYFRK